MDLVGKILRAIRNPTLFLRGLNRLYYTRFGFREFNENGVNVFDEDWDNLIILDAARFELFKQTLEHKKYGKLESRVSRGSNSYEFVLGNFFNKDLSDTVYITGNGHIIGMKEERDLNIHDIVMLERSEKGKQEGTHMPQDVRKETEDLLEDYDDKRVVVHFMQPHYPFLGDNNVPKKDDMFWHHAYSGELDLSCKQLWDAYEENFETAWREVEKLIESLEGKTVVTADHGNVFGERVSPFPNKEWGHPQGIYDEKLVKVPWLVIEGDERREIVEGESKDNSEEYDEEEIKSQLADLGYGSS